MNDLSPPDRPCPGAALYLGDCRDVLPLLPSGSFDLVFTDPPYPEISRSYGRWTEAEWWEMMRAVVPQCMRVLKLTGSAVFVLQPNSERVGRMRTWHLKFQLWVAEAWGIVQDAYWWNHTAMVTEGAGTKDMLRPSLKACVWVGLPSCFRDQGQVLWRESDRNKAERLAGRCTENASPSGWRGNGKAPRRKKDVTFYGAAGCRGGVTPFNVVVTGGCNRWEDGGGAYGHGASTPRRLCDFWVRYLCPPGGSVLDPFSGTATTGLAALKHGCDYTGIERVPEHHATARRRLADAAGPLFATPPAAGVV